MTILEKQNDKPLFLKSYPRNFFYIAVAQKRASHEGVSFLACAADRLTGSYRQTSNVHRSRYSSYTTRYAGNTKSKINCGHMSFIVLNKYKKRTRSFLGKKYCSESVKFTSIHFGDNG